MVSLRHLRDGQVLDYQGKVAGEVEAIIYQNAEAQDIYFKLKPRLVGESQAKLYGLPLEAFDLTTNRDGYDIKLSKEQTASLAEVLYE